MCESQYEIGLTSIKSQVDITNKHKTNFQVAVITKLLDIPVYPAYEKISDNWLECFKNFNSSAKLYFEISPYSDTLLQLENKTNGTIKLPAPLRHMFGFGEKDASVGPKKKIIATEMPDLDYFAALEIGKTLSVYIESPIETRRVTINRTTVTSAAHLVQEFNSKLKNHNMVFSENEKGFPQVEIKNKLKSLELLGPIARVLGELPNSSVRYGSQYVFKNFVAPSNNIDVYLECNIIEPQCVNNGCRKLLKKFVGTAKTELEFANIHYVKVAEDLVDKINIRLVDAENNLVPLKELSETHVCLHLRKIRQ